MNWIVHRSMFYLVVHATHATVIHHQQRHHHPVSQSTLSALQMIRSISLAQHPFWNNVHVTNFFVKLKNWHLLYLLKIVLWNCILRNLGGKCFWQTTRLADSESVASSVLPEFSIHNWRRWSFGKVKNAKLENGFWTELQLV